MNFQEFISEVTEHVSGKLGHDYDVVARKVLKNNSVELDSLVITYKKTKISPSIYLNRFYLEWINGRSIEDISKDIIEYYNECEQRLDGKSFICIDTEDSKERVIMRLVNYEKNMRILKECPHLRLNDLAVTYHFVISNDSENGLASARIDYNNIEFFNLTLDDLNKYALANTERLFPPVFEKMETLMKRYMRKRGFLDTERYISEDKVPMYVLTTAEALNGAVCILYKGMLERIQKAVGGDFYIIPSSVNEVMILPVNGMVDRRELDEMVKAVNEESVPETEILSDKVYRYPVDNFKISDNED